MDYRDTVLSPEELKAINNSMPSTAKYGEVFEVIADKQAETTWRRAIKEVIQWLYSPCPHTEGTEEGHVHAESCLKCWQEKGKEWEIEC